MYIINTTDLPYIECGGTPKRRLRLIRSPYTTGDCGISIVHASIPPGGMSEGHVHPECDETIYFENDGKTVVDGIENDVSKGCIVFVPKGTMHECINTSVSEDLNLLCIFEPSFEPYGPYPELIEKTKAYLRRHI